jgi:hypothetical protein
MTGYASKKVIAVRVGMEEFHHYFEHYEVHRIYDF